MPSYMSVSYVKLTYIFPLIFTWRFAAGRRYVCTHAESLSTQSEFPVQEEQIKVKVLYRRLAPMTGNLVVSPELRRTCIERKRRQEIGCVPDSNGLP